MFEIVRGEKESKQKEEQVWTMCLGPGSHLEADGSHYLCYNDDMEEENLTGSHTIRWGKECFGGNRASKECSQITEWLQNQPYSQRFTLPAWINRIMTVCICYSDISGFSQVKWNVWSDCECIPHEDFFFLWIFSCICWRAATYDCLHNWLICWSVCFQLATDGKMCQNTQFAVAEVNMCAVIMEEKQHICQLYLSLVCARMFPQL